MKVPVRTIASQPSWVIRTRQVELAVTQLGGHMAPVTFSRDTGRPVRPYYVSPWQDEGRKIDVLILVPLRGDFFCLPFGDNGEPFRGERHTCHGETATARWRLVDLEHSGPVTSLALAMRTKVRPGKVAKRLSLVSGQNVVYCRHVLEGYSGKMPLGHHATIALPQTPGAMRVATSPIRFGMTYPGWFSHPGNRGYQALAVGKHFKSLTRVPTLWKAPAWADLTSFPARKGYEDLAAVFSAPRTEPAWTAATNAEGRYLWFTLKDPAVLPALVLWISNGGRQGPPWDGRNLCLGLEDVCGYFADGLAASVRPNRLTRAGVPTAVTLRPDRPTAVNYIQGVVRIPKGFQQVRSAEFAPGEVTFVSTTGRKLTAPVCHEFLKTGQL